MNRRTFLRSAATTPITLSGVATIQEDKTIIEEISDGYFNTLPDSKTERNTTVVECANRLCTARKTVSEKVIDAVVNGGESTSHVVRRLQFGVRILNEYDITNTIDESMIEEGRQDLSNYTRYLPLIGSFNNLCDAACAVDTPDPGPETVKDFLFATVAFGLEVALWTVGAPYKMAWRGTRFVANRTFLRYARHGCSGCIALVMSELHWAIRGSVYGEVVTANKTEFIWEQIQSLQDHAEDWDYDVDIDYSKEEIQELINPEGGGAAMFTREKEGFIERLISGISLPDISLPFLGMCVLFGYLLRN